MFADDFYRIWELHKGLDQPQFLEYFNLYFSLFYYFDKYCDLKDLIFDVTEWVLFANLTAEQLM